ncbi:MAG: potassium-transporting ATPase subunit KdpA, partial [Allobranchiibius sp.]
MGEVPAGLLTILTLVAILALAHVPLGNHIADTYSSEKDLRVEQLIYRACGVSPRSQQRWTTYVVALIAFSVMSFAALFALCLAQPFLPLARGAKMDVSTAFNTAISFVTNTNWQSYAGESGASPVVQTLGLTIQNFVSAAVGIAVVIALIRGLTRSELGTVGNFWVDLVRGVVRILLPLAFIGAIVLLAGGVIQDLSAPETLRTLAGGTQTIQSGLVAGQEAIKELGTNGG